MDRDTVIALARQVWGQTAVLPTADIERFAAFVAAHEREVCAKVCEELVLKSADGQWGTYIAGWSDGTDDCAVAIRSRT